MTIVVGGECVVVVVVVVSGTSGWVQILALGQRLLQELVLTAVGGHVRSGVQRRAEVLLLRLIR